MHLDIHMHKYSDVIGTAPARASVSHFGSDFRERICVIIGIEIEQNGARLSNGVLNARLGDRANYNNKSQGGRKTVVTVDM